MRVCVKLTVIERTCQVDVCCVCVCVYVCVCMCQVDVCCVCVKLMCVVEGAVAVAIPNSR